MVIIMKNKRGFSVVELLVTMTLFIIILIPVLDMIIRYGHFSKAEHSRIRLQQESRFMLGSFAAELKNAGAVLSLANTGGFLGSDPCFNGIYPLNNNNDSDGVILAVGDPHAVTTLNTAFTPGAPSLDVETADVIDIDMDGDPAQWLAGDIGIVIGITEYYVFSVTSSDGINTINIRPLPIYYSGLLSTGNYIDTENDGSAITYPVDTPVMRLSSFSIYLFNEIYDSRLNRKKRQLIRVTDSKGQGNVIPLIGNGAYIISENIWDLQISYKAYPAFPEDITIINEYYAGGASSNSLLDLLSDIRKKFLKEINVNFVVISDVFSGKRGVINQNVPPLADRPSYPLPSGTTAKKINYYVFKVFNLQIEPRNFNLSKGV